ncbi:MAG: trigger factor [Oscillospiraceae bacterium]|jgi:trigger factor
MIVKNVEKKEKNEVSFQVEVDKDAFEEALNGAYLKNKKSISVPGFRKGKAPRMVIEGMYGAEVFYEDAFEDLAPKAFAFATEQEKLKTVGRPNLTETNVSDDKILTLSFEAALYPEVKLGKYKGVEVPRDDDTVTDEKVDEYIEEMRKRNARQITVERPAKLGDTVVIDYDGFLNGERFEGGKAEGQTLELGSNRFVPGFEEQIVGMKAGDEKDLDITFPEDYHESLAGKAVVFKVKVHEVQETELPVVDDEFAKDVSEFDTLSEYRVAIMEQLVKARKEAVDNDFGYKVIKAAADDMECDIPEAMIEERVGQIMQEYDQNLMARGMRLEEYMRMAGMDPKSFQDMIRPQAVEQVRTDLLLAAVADAENIEIPDEDVDKTLQDLADAYRITLDQIKEAVPRESIINDMRMRKANDIIMENAVALPPEEKKDENASEDQAEEKPAKKPAKRTKKAAAEKAEPAAEEEAPKAE